MQIYFLPVFSWPSRNYGNISWHFEVRYCKKKKKCEILRCNSATWQLFPLVTLFLHRRERPDSLCFTEEK